MRHARSLVVYRRPPKMFVTMGSVQSAPRAMRGARVVHPVMREVPLSERPLNGIDRQGIAHTLSGSPFAGVLGDDTTLTPAPPQPDVMPVLTRIDAATKTINDKIDAQDKNRKISLFIAGASALFAAVKLGIIAFPHIKARVSRPSES